MDEHTTKLLEEVRADVKDMRRLLIGNGKPGVIGDLRDLKAWRERTTRHDHTTGSRWWDVGKILIASVVTALVTTLTTLAGMGAL